MLRNPFQQLDDERKESEMRLQKMKSEMEAVFEQKVKEKIARLKESEASVSKINYFLSRIKSHDYIFLKQNH